MPTILKDVYGDYLRLYGHVFDRRKYGPCLRCKCAWAERGNGAGCDAYHSSEPFL